MIGLIFILCKWPISSIKKVILKIVVCTEIKLSYTLNYPSIFAYSFNTHLMFKFKESVAIFNFTMFCRKYNNDVILQKMLNSFKRLFCFHIKKALTQERKRISLIEFQ